jgi:hypothetical protein
MRPGNEPRPYCALRFCLTQAGPEHHALAALADLVALTGPLYPPVRYGSPPRHVYMQKLHG